MVIDDAKGELSIQGVWIARDLPHLRIRERMGHDGFTWSG